MDASQDGVQKFEPEAEKGEVELLETIIPLSVMRKSMSNIRLKYNANGKGTSDGNSFIVTSTKDEKPINTSSNGGGGGGGVLPNNALFTMDSFLERERDSCFIERLDKQNKIKLKQGSQRS